MPAAGEHGYVGRFAPTPSGRLHLGSMLAAIASYLDARSRGGRWLLRMDDLDTPRNEAGADAAIRAELERVGLHWDGPVQHQADNPSRYRHALDALRRRQLVYPCACSRRALVDGIYPGHCRNGLPPGATERSLRFRVGREPLRFSDGIQGECTADLHGQVGDFVVRRADGIPAYHLATVVDDAEAGVTHVLRGADLLSSTGRQMALQRALGLPTPRYAHLPLLRGSAGQKLSKQNLAPATDTQSPQRIWVTCLRALGQRVEPELEQLPLGQLKARAVDAWRLGAVPTDL